MRLIAFILALLLPLPAMAAMECDTTTEERIQATIAEQPDKLVTILEGDRLAAFISGLTLRGYMIGVLPYVDHIYIVDAGKLPGYTTDNVWLYFVQDGCLIYALPASKAIILGIIS